MAVYLFDILNLVPLISNNILPLRKAISILIFIETEDS